MPKLLIAGRSGERVHSFGDCEVVLGSDASCDVVIAGGDVSPEHCKIQPVMGAWKIVDLESDAGTRVNGAYVNQRPLRSGDVLELGDVRVVFQAAGAAVAAPARGVAASSPRAGGRRTASSRGGRRARDDAPPGRERPVRRARRRQSNGGLTALLIMGALLVIAGGGYLLLKPGTSPNELVFMRMQKAAQAMDWQGVLREGQAGSARDPDFGKRIADLRTMAEQQIVNDAGREKLGEATKAWNALRLWRQDDNWKNDDEYVSRLDAFLAEYARYGGASVDIARQERALVAGSAEAGEARNVGEAWARLQADVKALKANGLYGLAMQKAEEFGSQWGAQDADFAQQARMLRTTLRSDAEKWLGLQISRAQHKIDQGTKFQARKILEKAAERIGIPELEARAADILRELMQ